jgi:flagellar motor protein MotB
MMNTLVLNKSKIFKKNVRVIPPQLNSTRGEVSSLATERARAGRQQQQTTTTKQQPPVMLCYVVNSPNSEKETRAWKLVHLQRSQINGFQHTSLFVMRWPGRGIRINR